MVTANPDPWPADRPLEGPGVRGRQGWLRGENRVRLERVGDWSRYLLPAGLYATAVIERYTGTGRPLGNGAQMGRLQAEAVAGQSLASKGCGGGIRPEA